MIGVESSLRYEPRLRTIEALRDVAKGDADRENLEAAASIAQSVGEERARPFYSFLSALLRSLAFLVSWAKAVRGAEADATRFLVAGKQALRDYNNSTGEADIPEIFSEIVSDIENIQHIEAIVEIAKAALRVPIPVLLSGSNYRCEGQSSVPESAKQIAPEDSTTTVILLEFSIGSAPLREPHLIKPSVLYDLTVRARLSRWPEGQDHLILTPMHVEPPGSLEVPVFTLKKPADLSAPIEVSTTGRLCAHVSLDFPARPLEVTFANTSNVACGSHTVLAGQVNLSFEVVDHTRNPVTGISEVDLRLLEIRCQLRSYGVSDEEMAAFLTVLGAAGRVAGLNLAGNIYRGNAEEWPEKRFQRDFRDRLRSTKEIGLDLEEHPQSGGGITDLSFRRIRLELKVSSNSSSTKDALASHGAQLAQYISGSDRRTGLLVVLELVKDRGTTASVGDDIDLSVMDSGSGGTRPILAGVVVIRGNLPPPSSLA